ncbi:MAG: aminoglycoside phosphotransferase family protein [Deltaproteobacteria bacterium]|nr:aminoglycoside phosphotransferase family protein [Deltaproteobacteria bacterium]
MLKNHLKKNWENYTGTTLPTTLDIAPITSCTADYGNDVILIFTGRNRYPEYVMKICRSSKYGFKLENEFAALKSRSSIKSLSTYIPTPYYIGEVGQQVFFLQGAFPGTNLFRLIKKRGMSPKNERLLNQSVELLAAINTSKTHLDSKNTMGNPSSADILFRFEREFIHSGISKKKINELQDYLQQSRRNPIRFFLHGDYWPANILVDERENRINGIIDWEFAAAQSTSPMDIIWFLVNLGYCLHLHKDSSMDIPTAFVQTFFSRGVYAETLADLFDRYVAMTKIDRGSFRILLEITLAVISMRELIAYGKHSAMDRLSLKMLLHTVENEKSLCV